MRREQLQGGRQEPVERSRVDRVEGGRAARADLLRGRSRRSSLRAARITSVPSSRAARAVARPMSALPPMTTTVCPSSCGVMPACALLGV
jgi:hypothetical protein